MGELRAIRAPQRARIESGPRLALSVREAARACGIGRDLIYGAINRRELASIKVGNRRLIPTASLEQFLRDRLASAT